MECKIVAVLSFVLVAGQAFGSNEEYWPIEDCTVGSDLWEQALVLLQHNKNCHEAQTICQNLIKFLEQNCKNIGAYNDGSDLPCNEAVHNSTAGFNTLTDGLIQWLNGIKNENKNDIEQGKGYIVSEMQHMPRCRGSLQENCKANNKKNLLKISDMCQMKIEGEGRNIIAAVYQFINSQRMPVANGKSAGRQ